MIKLLKWTHTGEVYLSACLISEATERISIKFDIGNLH
jgi:hypothetical protein